MADFGQVTIAGNTRNLSDIDESWVTQQVNRRRRDGLPVCVVVKLQTSGINVTLASPGCAGGGGGGVRPPNPRERNILDLWDSHRLNTNEFSGGNLLVFLKQVLRLF